MKSTILLTDPFKLNGAVTSTQQFIWRGKQLCEERDANNSVTKRFFEDGEQISGSKYYYTRDHLGSVREMTDGTGAIRARYEYDPYGRVTQVSGDLTSDFRYTGHYYHAPSGLHLALYRAYDADTGRWLNRDPIGEEGGINLYGYVGNEPINTIDFLGLRDFTQEEIDSGINEGVSGLLVRIRQTLALREHDIDKWKELERGSKQIGSVGKTLGISCTADAWEHSWSSWALALVYTPRLLAASLSGEEELLSTYTESELMRQTFYLQWLSEQKPKPSPSTTPTEDK